MVLQRLPPPPPLPGPFSLVGGIKASYERKALLLPKIGMAGCFQQWTPCVWVLSTVTSPELDWPPRC